MWLFILVPAGGLLQHSDNKHGGCLGMVTVHQAVMCCVAVVFSLVPDKSKFTL